MLLIDHFSGDLLLSEADFPSYYVNMAHPEDYKITQKPIKYDLFYHDEPNHFRLLLRISAKLDTDRFMPLTFVCCTGYPLPMYLGNRTIQIFKQEKKIKAGHFFDTKYGKIPIHETPKIHQPANIIGGRVLRHLQLNMSESPYFNLDVDHL
jgi:hypothetical protein